MATEYPDQPNSGERTLRWLPLPFRRAAQRFVMAGKLRSRRRTELRLLANSSLFDADWYLATYPDIAAANVDPAIHYLDCGWQEGRNPSANFCSSDYLSRHADVARIGVNPLIHFIEHGSFEGREIEGVVDFPLLDRIPRIPADQLPPAHPVFKATAHRVARISWLRACNLRDMTDSVTLDGLGLARTASAADRAAIHEALAGLEWLSGSGPARAEDLGSHGDVPKAVDWWFSTSHRLISRWQVCEPVVVRAVQLNPVTNRLGLVGEGLALDPMDPVTFDLFSPTMPILLLATGLDGSLRGIRRLVFPSLIRGGMHYPELIDIGLDRPLPIDLLSISAELERNLRQIRAGRAGPLVKKISVDLAGADGTGAIFQRDLRQLLNLVMGVEVAPVGKRQDIRSEHCWQALLSSSVHEFRQQGASLEIAADMIPTLRVLTSIAPSGEVAGDGTVVRKAGLIVCDPDPAQPALSFVLPDDYPIIEEQSGNWPMAFPAFCGGNLRCPAAIRVARRPLGEAELLFPDLALKAEQASDLSVSWLIDWADGNYDLLAQSLTALSLQVGLAEQRLCFLRPPSGLVQRVAETEFEGRWRQYSSIDEALASNPSAILGYLGHGVVLHDARTASLVASLLLHPDVSSGSCAFVVSSRHGKSWRTQSVDDESLLIDRKVVFGGLAANAMEMLWRSVFPVQQPASRFWMMKKESLESWLIGASDGRHLVTTAVAASIDPNELEAAGQSWLPGPPEVRDQSIIGRVLVG
jgi:hypothetical protein